jgi:putative ABC transport system substrate-binding protein
MRRRNFIAGLAGAAAWPVVARAQQPNRAGRIGLLTQYVESDPQAQATIRVLRDSLGKLGWVEARNLRIDVRFAGASQERLRVHAMELVGLGPNVLFVTGVAPLSALHQLTRTIPIVFVGISDPVASGFITEVARPGGNITGFARYDQAISVKWLELLKQIAPQVRYVTYLYDPANVAWGRYLSAIESISPLLSVDVSAAAVRDATEIERALGELATRPNTGLIVLGSPATNVHRQHIIDLAARHRLPAVYWERYTVVEGGLASYGVNVLDQLGDAARYVDRIFKGEKPGDLPLQFPTKFELVINLKTAKALGLTIPETLLATADEVIQ